MNEVIETEVDAIAAEATVLGTSVENTNTTTSTNTDVLTEFSRAMLGKENGSRASQPISTSLPMPWKSF